MEILTSSLPDELLDKAAEKIADIRTLPVLLRRRCTEVIANARVRAEKQGWWQQKEEPKAA